MKGCEKYAALLKQYGRNRPDNYEGALENLVKGKRAALGVKSVLPDDLTDSEDDADRPANMVIPATLWQKKPDAPSVPVYSVFSGQVAP